MRRSGHHVLLSVPTRGSIRWETVTALEAARDYTPGLGPILWQPGNLSVALTRNRVVKQFLAGDWTTLAMVDDDIAPPVNFLEMLDPLIPEYGIVALAHPMPAPGDQSQIGLGAFIDGPDGFDGMSLNVGINECHAVATGCVVISRALIEALGPTPFRMQHDPDAAIQSDDFLFCAAARAVGFKVGAYWEGRAPDHFATVNLAPLFDAQRLPAGRST